MKLSGAVALIALVVCPAILGAATCSSSQACVDCFQEEGKPARCLPVTYDASCECSIDVSFPQFCILDGECDYGNQGGGASGGSGSGDQVCFRLPGQWCPAECTSCETIFWV